MIRFFRKIRQNLLSDGKTGKPALPAGRYLKYAIGEIILVMIGILLALQVNNWNEQRIASNKEKILLSELHQEFLENRKQFEIIISKHQNALLACDTLIAMFPIDIEKVNLDSLSQKARSLKSRWTFNPSQGIINALVNTSSFELISNRELRQFSVSWNDVLLDYQEDEISSKKYVEEVLNPFVNKHFKHPIRFKDPRVNIKMLASLEFENIVRQRKEHLLDILGRDLEFSTIKTTIDRIIELSEPEKS